jgi:hypothetical protein
MRTLLEGVEFPACSEANVQDDVWGWGGWVSWREERGDGAGDGGVGYTDGLMVHADMDWSWIAWRRRDQGGEHRGNFPGGVSGVFIKEGLGFVSE